MSPVTPELLSAIAKLREKGEAYGIAKTVEQSLEDDRAAIKADAIQRVMKREGIAATRAEAIVETDEEYFLHREKQRASIIARYKADAEYWAAKCETTQTSLVTPDVLAMDAEITELASSNHSLRSSHHSLLVTLKELREANYELVQANRELAEQLVNAKALHMVSS